MPTRARYKAFIAARPEAGAKGADIDSTLKGEQSDDQKKVLRAGKLEMPPDGVFVKSLVGGASYLLLDGAAYPWNFSG